MPRHNSKPKHQRRVSTAKNAHEIICMEEKVWRGVGGVLDGTSSGGNNIVLDLKMVAMAICVGESGGSMW